MIQELVNTSISAGLLPGSEGFCTVACTQSMDPIIRSQLELMGGYRVLWKLGDPKADKNPLLLSHYRLLIGGCFYNVLSRIAVCGADHQGRLNRLAHHIILENSDHLPQGPAAVLQDNDAVFTQWNAPPQYLPIGRIQLSPRTILPEACKTWQQLSGDAGWAGEIAQAAVNDPTKSSCIIYEPGMDVIALLNEAFSLVPASRKWDVTFSTHFDILPPKADFCTWRFCAAGTRAAAEAAEKASSGILIDLTAKCPPAGEGYYARLARTGNAEGDDEIRMTYSSSSRSAAQNNTPSVAPSAQTGSTDKKERLDDYTPPPAKKYARKPSPVKTILAPAAIILIVIQAVVILTLLTQKNAGNTDRPDENISVTTPATQTDKAQPLIEKLSRENDELRQKLLVAENLRESQAVQIQNLQKQNERLQKIGEIPAASAEQIKNPSPIDERDTQTPSVVPANTQTKPIPEMPQTFPADGYIKLPEYVPTEQFRFKTNSSSITLPCSPISQAPLLLLPCKLPDKMELADNKVLLESKASFGQSKNAIVEFSAAGENWAMVFKSAEYGPENIYLASLRKFETIMKYSTVRCGRTVYQFIKPANLEITAGGNPQVFPLPNDVVTLEAVAKDLTVKEPQKNSWTFTVPEGVRFVAAYAPSKSKDQGKFSISLDTECTLIAIDNELKTLNDSRTRFMEETRNNLKAVNIPSGPISSADGRKQILAELAERLRKTKNEQRIAELRAANRSLKKLHATMERIDTLNGWEKWLGEDRSFNISLRASKSEALLYRIKVSYKK